jgi:two-component system phosphate regulon sensor histidine kinase PhoR
VTFRTRTFLGVFLASAAALALATVLIERVTRGVLYVEIRETLLGEAHLIARQIRREPAPGDFDGEADDIGRLLGARVTFIAADGRVLGDSEVAAADLPALENHSSRPEIVEAGRTGTGTNARVSATTGVETLYAAIRVDHESLAYIRVALPLTVIENQASEIRRVAILALAAGLVIAAVATAAASILLNRRLRAMADAARRYTAGDFSRPARDYGRDEIGMVAGVLDRTARELGQRLADSARARARTDAILAAMVEGVLLVDRTGRVVLINRALGTLLGSTDKAEGRQYIEVVRQPALASMIAAALAGEPTSPVEVETDREPRRQAVANVVPVPGEHGDGAVLVLHDITDLRRADRVRRDFVANVSHELRTPLTAIRGYVEALLDSPPAPDEARRFLDVIARHAERMERLVHDLLRLARLDAGQEPAARGPVDVEAALTAATQDLQPLLTARRIAVNLSPDGERRVTADARKLQDVLKNLLENAANYSPEGGTIDVTVTRADSMVDIVVADRGPGVPEADLPRIFERFYRVDRSRSRDPGGTGLGLSIVKHLVELQGGTVRAAQRPGGGAMFTVRLPA